MPPFINPKNNESDEDSPLQSPWDKKTNCFFVKMRSFANWRYYSSIRNIEREYEGEASPLTVEKHELVPYLGPS